MDEEEHELAFIDLPKRRHRWTKQVRCCLEVSAVSLLVVVIVILAVILGVALNRSREKCSTVTATCQSDACLELANVVQKNLDTSVDPCEDFYNFSCGGWLKSHSIPSGYPGYSPFNQLNKENENVLIEIINSNKDDDIEAIVKARTLYHSCHNTSYLDSLGAKPLLELVNKFGGWELISNSGSGSGSGLDTDSDNFFGSDTFLLQKLNGNPAFFTFFVGVDDKNSSKYTLFLEQDGLTLPSPESYTDSKATNSLKSYIVNILQLLNPHVSRTVYMKVAENIIELEVKLSNIFVSAVELRDPEATYNRMKIGDLSTAFPNTFNWSHILQYSFLIGKAPEILTSDYIVVCTTSYFQNLSYVLAGTDSLTLYNYVMWQLVRGYTTYLSQNFSDVYYEFTGNVTGSGAKPRNITCISLVQKVLPIALARLYTEFILPEGTKSSIITMISHIKHAFKERVNDSVWLDGTTKQRCIEKVDAITQKVAYPASIYHDSYVNHLYENYSIHADMLLHDMAQVVSLSTVKNLKRLHSHVDKSEWNVAPTAVNAYYNPSFNQFTFLEGILAPPFFQANWPDYFNYGAFGMVIGHELTHGFDDEGQQYDKDGILRKWWTNSSLETFKKKQLCFQKQYSQYQTNNQHINGNLTLGENIADNGGLKTSYQAYKNAIKKEGPQPHLPGLQYTPDQLFFIAFGQLWCSQYMPEYVSLLLQVDSHSLAPFRVEGSLVNNGEFSEAFQCPRTARMNPAGKCLLW